MEQNANSSDLSNGSNPVVSTPLTAVAIDCEAIKATDESQMLARISIVSHKYEVLLDEYVLPTGPVLDYLTDITGITPEILSQKGKPYDFVMKRVQKILKDKIIVAHGMCHDLRMMGIKEDLDPKIVRDTANFKLLRRKSKRRLSLKDLTLMWFNREIQKGAHSSVEDAKATMRLYLKVKNKWEKMVVEGKCGYTEKSDRIGYEGTTEYF